MDKINPKVPKDCQVGSKSLGDFSGETTQFLRVETQVIVKANPEHPVKVKLPNPPPFLNVSRIQIQVVRKSV